MNRMPWVKLNGESNAIKRAAGNEVGGDADHGANNVGAGKHQLAGLAVPGVNDLGQGVGLGGNGTDSLAKGVDEQDHQRAPQAVVDGPGNPVGVAGGGRGVHRRRPDPCGRHASRGNSKADLVAGGHVTVGIFILAANKQASSAACRRKTARTSPITVQLPSWWSPAPSGTMLCPLARTEFTGIPPTSACAAAKKCIKQSGEGPSRRTFPPGTSRQGKQIILRRRPKVNRDSRRKFTTGKSTADVQPATGIRRFAGSV